MSLCILLRSPSGEAMMAADTALSLSYGGKSYRVNNVEDYEKAIEHQGNLIFASGLYNGCKEIRAHIRKMNSLDIEALQKYAIELYNTEDYPGIEYGDTAIMICRNDGSIVTMRARDNFAIEVNAPPSGSKDNVINITTIGAKSSEQAYQNAIEFSKDIDCGIPLLAKTYASVLSEKVGGHLVVYHRLASGEVVKSILQFTEPNTIRRVTALDYAHCEVHASAGVFKGDIYARRGNFGGVVQASDYLDASGKSMLTSSGKFSSSCLDLGNIQLDGVTGDITMSGNINIGGNIDFSRAGSITWGNSAPVKYQFSTGISGPWHTNMQSTDKYRRDSLDGGINWGPGYQFLGVNGLDGKNGTDASVTRANIVMAMLDNLSDDGLYTTNINGRQCLGIRADAIKVGTLNSIDITGCNITSLNSMTAACDFHVGDRIYLGGKRQSGKAIIFNDNASISNPYDSDGLEIATLGGISLSSGQALDLSGINHITWGHNAPVAVFG